MLTRALFIAVLGFAALVIVAALLNMVPSTAAHLVALASLLFAAGSTYLVSFRGPDIRLIPVRDGGVTNYLASGYSAGMPSTWNIVARFIAANDGARPGILSRFEVDAHSIEHLPRQSQAFEVTFSTLETAAGGPDHAAPVTLPLLLGSKARCTVECRAILHFTTADPNALADDLREVSGFRVKFSYWSGTEGRPTKKRSGRLHLTYHVLRQGVRDYWSGVPHFLPLVTRLEGD